MSSFIPYGRHYIDQEDIKAVEGVLKGDWLTCGNVVEDFEKKLCEITGSPYAVSCSNGTTALHMALLVLGLQAGDIVIVPAITFLATANTVRFVGADVVFADVDPDTGLMTAQTLENAIKQYNDPSQIKAVINVHLNGQCEDLEAIYKVAKSHNLFLIEDAAHAVGTYYTNQKEQKYAIGSNTYSDLTTFSFHPVKTIAMGEGGAITCKSDEMVHSLKLLRSHGMIRNLEDWQCRDQGFDAAMGTPNPWYYEMQNLGFNYRVSDINCALGLSQLNKIWQFKEKREQIAERYDLNFKNEPHVSPLKKHSFSDTAWHLYVIKIDFKAIGQSRAQVMNSFHAQEIGTQVHYLPLYRQPYYQKLYGLNILPGAESYYNACLSIPLYVGLTDMQQDRVIKAIQTL